MPRRLEGLGFVSQWGRWSKEPIGRVAVRRKGWSLEPLRDQLRADTFRGCWRETQDSRVGEGGLRLSRPSPSAMLPCPLVPTAHRAETQDLAQM